MVSQNLFGIVSHWMNHRDNIYIHIFIYIETRIKLVKTINESVLSHSTFYREDDEHTPVDFFIEIISFSKQLSKI